MYDWIPDLVNAEPEDTYTCIPNEMLRSSELSGTAVKLLGLVCSNKKGWKNWNSSIRKHMKEGEKAIRTAKKELEAKGYWKLIRYRDAKTKRFIGSFISCAFSPDNHKSEELLSIIEKLKKEGIEVKEVKAHGVNSTIQNIEPHTEKPHTENLGGGKVLGGKVLGGKDAYKNNNNKKTKKKNTKNLPYSRKKKEKPKSVEKTSVEKTSVDKPSVQYGTV
ncbi:MAG: hypothetical protein EOM04_09370, partial [Clostridia bacterium]|nr:hypothetical protein [Clostridia bacterium]